MTDLISLSEFFNELDSLPVAEHWVAWGKAGGEGRLDFSDALHLAVRALSCPNRAFNFAWRVLEARWPEAEPIIAKDPQFATYYAQYLVRGAWEQGEQAIAQDPIAASWYATQVLRQRWPVGESVISQDAQSAVDYA
jgi:hypothetical protein